MNRGYIRLYRKSLDAGWIKNHKLWAFWTYCLMKASHKEFDAIVGLQIVHLYPGQFIFGLRVASKETGLSIQEIRTILDFLRKAGNLTIKSTNKFSVISIMNWAVYQSDDTGNQHTKQQTTNKPLTTYKNINTKILLSDSIEYGLADLLLNKIISRNPGFKKPSIQTWAKHIDLMIRIDKRNAEDIQAVIEWCQQDQFWQNNILSTGKLRKQFDQLSMQMNAAGIKSAAVKIGRPVGPETFECSRCGRRIIVKNDLTESGCVYCQMEART